MYEEFKVVLMMMRARSRDELLWLAMSKGRWMYQGMTERMEEEVERSKKRRETFEYIMQGRMGENEEEKRERLKQLEEKAILADEVGVVGVSVITGKEACILGGAGDLCYIERCYILIGMDLSGVVKRVKGRPA